MTSLRRRALVGVLTFALAAATVAPATGAPDFTITRLSGEDRYATAAAIAQATYGGSQAAIIATGETFPDALAGSFVAGYVNAPILLVKRTEVPQVTRDALAALQVSELVLLGGPAAISFEVQQELEEAFAVVRLQGSDRFATAANIALAVNPADIGELEGKRTAFLAYGYAFADALAAGPLANAGRFPMLLTGGSGLGSPARAALDRLDIEHVVIVGGEQAISAGTVDELTAMNITSERVAGADRYATSAALADLAVTRLDFVDDHVDIAKGADPNDADSGFADALAAAPHSGGFRSALLLTASTELSSATKAWLEAHAATLTIGHVLGGEAAVPPSVVTEAETAGGKAPPA